MARAAISPMSREAICATATSGAVAPPLTPWLLMRPMAPKWFS
jgi:hypothetical protein